MSIVPHFDKHLTQKIIYKRGNNDINAMYDVTKNFLIGLEYDTGAKQIVNTNTQTSTVNRIAIGMMVGF
ncbi:hypothetical protein [Flavobacterium sp. N1736]|uniref:hypothetical protein n=1 Tax=Flavobacterium sp. N1736 TaxID=2986823 RepID=UPI0022243D05|nr:hypothetical protein [Flavobacterium sp. N1736]